jgi:hypothetical protein
MQVNSIVKVSRFLFLVFLLGVAMNFYEQGSDPQFFIQPQFFIFWILLLVFSFSTTTKVYSFSLCIFLCTVLIIKINYSKYIDLNSINNVRIIENAIDDYKKTIYIGRGFENFIPIAALEWGGRENFHYLHYPGGYLYEIELSDSEYLKMAVDSIEKYANNGYNLVLIDFINKDPKDIGTSFYGYDLTSKIILLQNYFKENYYLEQIPNTWQYNFYIMTSKNENDY